MLDLTSRDTLPKDSFDRVKLPTPDEQTDPTAYSRMLAMLREDYAACSRYVLDEINSGHDHFGDDCGDYMMAAASYAAWLNTHFGFAMWHSELSQQDVDRLNDLLNCKDEEHCIHQYACDGVSGTHADRLAVDWEHCPLLNPPGFREEDQ